MKSLPRFLKVVSFSLGIVILTATTLFSQSKDNQSSVNRHWSVKPFERKAFIENKGQFENSLPENKKTFNYCIDKGYQVFFYGNEINYRFTKYTKSKETLIDKFRSEEKREAKEHEIKSQIQYVNVKWLNSNPNATIVVEDKQSTYYSYQINNNSEKPYTEMCAGYSKLIYKNLYDGIDIEYIFHPDNGIEYTLLIHPGADITKVQMQYLSPSASGRTPLLITRGEGGEVHIPTLLGDIVDHAPLTYYANTKEKIASSFNISNDIVSFNISPYLKDQEIVVDPWTVVPGFSPSKAYDNGVDNSGNIYIYGGASGNLVVEKYASTGGAPIWSLVNGLAPSTYSATYYGDMLVEGSGNFYIAEACNLSGAHTQKFSPTSSTVWISSTPGADFREHWRLALNCITGKVIVAGGGTLYNSNIAEIDVTTGVLSNIKALNAPDDISGLCVDDIGKSYTHGGMTNKLSFNDATNTPIGVVSSGYSHSEAATGYNAGYSNGYNMMVLGGTTFLFTCDGATLKKWDRNTRALLGTVTIPGGQAKQGSGILADKCNNLFVGASNGVYRFDFNLVQQEYHSTTAAVFDIAYATLNSDIVACGYGFLTPLAFGRESCVSDTLLILANNPCNSSINSVVVRPLEGVPPYTFLWDDGSTDSVRHNLSVGVHLVTVRDGACVPSFHTDSVKIVNSAMTSQKTNPSCATSNNGQIKIILLLGQTITGATWTPVVTCSQLNDSTIQATGLLGGTYHCHVISNFGCTFDTTITLVAPPLLLDSLTSRRVKCLGDINGSAKAYGYGGASPYTYSWNTTPVQATQAATGLSVGKHIVTITDSNSCVKIDSVLIGSNPQPVAGFSTVGVCVGDTTFFTNTSTVASGGFTSSWLMGYNGTSTTTTNTKYLYPLCNNYMATLVVTSDSGCVAALTDTVFVSCKPTASFTLSNVCTYKAATFTNTSIGATSYSWDFDYNTGIDNTTVSPIHFYAPGNYSVQLVAHSPSGCSDTIVHSIAVYSKPVANFSTTSPCLAQSAVFNDSSHVAGDTITGWSWNFADSSPLGTTQNISHPYLSPGTYPASLIATSNKGCKDTVILNVNIHPLPDAQFSSANVCDGSAVPFSSLSTITSPDVIQTIVWNFADASPVDNNQPTTHLYTAPGSYTVQLLAVSNFGCRDSIAKTIIVRPNPTVAFTASDTVGCAPLCLSFTDLSTTIAGSTVVQWTWNVGDGSAVGHQQNFEHCYTNTSADSNAYFSVTLTVMSDSGCSSTKIKNKYITVYPNPKASFGVQPQATTITEPLISITDMTQGGNSWTWNFGDQSSSSVFSPPNHIYSDTGSYTITLITSTLHGCADTAYQTITIEPDFIFYIPNAFTPNGDNINDTFTGKGIYIKEYQMMIYDRWGNLIFFTDDIHKPWDGTANHGNEIAQRDVYVYVVDVTDFRRKKHNYKGIVTLVR